MTSLPNIERRAFVHRGEYIGWRASDGEVYHINRTSRTGPWIARPRDNASASSFYGDSLTAVSKTLAAA
jgi:hypothetical protein